MCHFNHGVTETNINYLLDCEVVAKLFPGFRSSPLIIFNDLVSHVHVCLSARISIKIIQHKCMH